MVVEEVEGVVEEVVEEVAVAAAVTCSSKTNHDVKNAAGCGPASCQ